MHALVTRTRKIYMRFAALTPGGTEELQAIQVHDREDDALLIVSDEPEEQTPPLRAPLRRRSAPTPVRVRGRLATFGHVVDEGELADLVRYAANAAP